MLSEQTIKIVKSTAPLLEEHAEMLTQHFYKRMFHHNPEVAPFFNTANQLGGSQQKALAGAICAYAANIDNLEVLGNVLESITQKHASLQIKPEHYPIVGDNLLASVQEVLGEAATDDVINAWAEAYSFLASILMGREEQIYHEHATTGGWEGFKPFRVIRKEVESTVITSFYLVPADGKKLPQFKPGQYITVRVPSLNGYKTMRNYSLSDKPGHKWFRISVKRECGQEDSIPDGYVSNLLHCDVDVDTLLEIAPPCGEFFLDVSEKHKRPLVLLAAGIGITPILSILLTALDTSPEREIIFIHGNLNEDTHAFKKTVNALAAKYSNLKVHYRYSDYPKEGIVRENSNGTGFIDTKLIESMIPERDADCYFCGPKPFMVGIYHELLRWGIPSSQIHFEFFGPRQELEKTLTESI